MCLYIYIYIILITTVGYEWVTGLGLDVTNSGGKWDMCLCFGCGGVGESGWPAFARVCEGGVVLCLCVL